jgi:hypothetical protein
LIRLWTVVLLGTAVLWPPALLAQSPSESSGSARAGDRFIYDTKDEVTGEPKGSYVAVVTEVSDKEIVNSISIPGKPGSRLVVYDRNLNRIDDSTWKFKPNDGQGVRLPLTVGKTWRIEYEARNIQSGAVFRTTGMSKVAGQETVTTSAGTFETFKIESHFKSYNTVDQTKSQRTISSSGMRLRSIDGFVARRRCVPISAFVQAPARNYPISTEECSADRPSNEQRSTNGSA